MPIEAGGGARQARIADATAHALNLAIRNAEARLYTLPLKADPTERASLEAELRTYREAAEAKPTPAEAVGPRDDLARLTRQCGAGAHTTVCQIVGIDRRGNPALRWSCAKCPVNGGYIAWSPSLGEWESIDASDLRIFGTPTEEPCAYCEAPGATLAADSPLYDERARYCNPTCLGLAGIAGTPGEHGTHPEP